MFLYIILKSTKSIIDKKNITFKYLVLNISCVYTEEVFGFKTPPRTKKKKKEICGIIDDV